VVDVVAESRGDPCRSWPSPALLGLARDVDVAGDLADEHVRWAIYQAALRHEAYDALRDVLAHEPDHVMGSGAVVAALEQVPRADRSGWVAVARGWTTADFVSRRADELRIAEDVRQDGPVADRDSSDDVGTAEIGSWSDWLQRRAANPSTRADVLGLLAEHGRTRRVRNRAAEALRRRA
jgi:hypothetical protein